MWLRHWQAGLAFARRDDLVTIRKSLAMSIARYAVNLSLLFTELPLLERPAAAAEAGFGGAGFWWPFATAVPGDRDVEAFVRAVEDAGVSLTGLNFFAGDMPAGDRGLVS